MNSKYLPYIVAGLTFGAMFVVVGYLSHAAGSGAGGAWSLWFWLTYHPFRTGVHLWFAFGAAVGVGLRYSFRSRSA